MGNIEYVQVSILNDFISDSTDKLLVFLYYFPVVHKICLTFLNQIACINVTLEDSSAGNENVKLMKWKDEWKKIFLTMLL